MAVSLCVCLAGCESVCMFIIMKYLNYVECMLHSIIQLEAFVMSGVLYVENMTWYFNWYMYIWSKIKDQNCSRALNSLLIFIGINYFIALKWLSTSFTQFSCNHTANL